MMLAAHDLSVALGHRTVLTNISLTLAPGTMTAVIGANGAGKSTLLRTFAGLLTPSQGHVSLDDRRLNAMAADTVARAIGYLPQQRQVYWPLTVARTVGLGRMPHRAATVENAVAVDRAMTEMDVFQFRDRPVTELSGGELARVLMARVLAQETAVILADEPTAGLDPAHQLALLERLAALARQGRTIVVALHDLSLAARYCDQIALLHNGQLRGVGPATTVLTSSLLRQCFGIEVRLADIDGIPVVLPVRLC